MWKALTIPEKMARYRELDGCWIWTGPLDGKGYGLTHDGSRGIRAHRLAYLFHVGDLPEGAQVHHVCERKACINPDHLVAVTTKQHKRHHLRDYCHRGHLKTVYASGRRRCYVCEGKTRPDPGWVRRSASSGRTTRSQLP